MTACTWPAGCRSAATQRWSLDGAVYEVCQVHALAGINEFEGFEYVERIAPPAAKSRRPPPPARRTQCPDVL